MGPRTTTHVQGLTLLLSNHLDWVGMGDASFEKAQADINTEASITMEEDEIVHRFIKVPVDIVLAPFASMDGHLQLAHIYQCDVFQ